MTLHRRIPVGLAMPETDPSVTQVAPTFGANDLVQTVRIPGPGTILWWGIGYNGNTDASDPVDGTGATLDAKIVLRMPGKVGRVTEYVGMSPISVALGFPMAWGAQSAIERDLPDGAEGWLILDSLTVGASPATHLWMSYRFIRGAGVGV